MLRKRLRQAKAITSWVVLVLVDEQHLSNVAVEEFTMKLAAAMKEVGT